MPPTQVLPASRFNVDMPATGGLASSVRFKWGASPGEYTGHRDFPMEPNFSKPMGEVLPEPGVYYVAACGVNDLGEGALSNEVNVDYRVPDAPSLGLSV
ncbi:MAG: hypothetical protein ACE147_00620 [Candidatus Methylomirabilales bacterium]